MFYEFISQYRTLICLIFVVALLVALFGITNLRVTPDNRVFYGPNNVHFQRVLEFEAEYISSNNILFVLGFPDKLSTRDHALSIRWLTDRVWSLDGVVRVDSLSTYPEVHSSRDTITVTPLLDLICPPQNKCKNDTQALLGKEHLVNRLFNHDLTSTGVLATVNIDVGTLTEIQAMSLASQEIIEEFMVRFPDVEIVSTGGVPMMAAFASSSEKDLSLLLPIAFLSIVSLLYLFLGGLKPTLILVGNSLMAGVFAMGVGGLFGMTINNATAVVPLVVFTLVVASSMHLMLHYLRLRRETPGIKEPPSAAKAALQSNLSPTIVSTTTSIIGLISLTFVDSPPLQQLGQLSALGLLFGSLSTVLVIPPILGRLSYQYYSKISEYLQVSLNWYARHLEQKKSIAGVSLVILLSAIFGYTNLEINDDFVDYFDKDTSFRQQTDRATELLSGPNHIEVLLKNNLAHGVFSPEYIRYLDNLVSMIRSQNLVSNVSSFSDLLADVSRGFGSDVSGPPSAEKYAQWYLAYELSLQRGQSNTDYINRNQDESRISVLLGTSTSKDIRLLESRIYSWHQSNDTEYDLLVTGENIPVAHVSETNISAMSGGLALSIAMVALVVGISLKRLAFGIAAMVASLAPVFLGFGVWGLLGNDIGLASTAIIALTIGVVIDDAVHMLYRYLDGKSRLRLDAWHAAAYSVHRVGTAITTTSVVMVGGLSILFLSSFKVNSSFGTVTCIIISIALAFDLLVFPRLLVLMDYHSKESSNKDL